MTPFRSPLRRALANADRSRSTASPHESPVDAPAPPPPQPLSWPSTGSIPEPPRPTQE